jgi:hypothetical protein
MTLFCYRQLTSDEKIIYDSFVKGLSDNGTCCILAGGELSATVIRKIINAVKFDHPEFIHVDFGSNIGCRKLGLTGSTEYSFASSNFSNDIWNKLFLIRDSFQKYAACSDYDKVWVVKQYLADTVEYNRDSLNAYLDAKEFDHDVLTIVGALINNRAVCEGFAKAAVWLLEYLGVECGVAEGWRKYGDCEYDNQNNHAWNVVKVNGNWYHLDIASDVKVQANKHCAVIPNSYCTI